MRQIMSWPQITAWLDSLAPPAEPGVGVSVSDELFDVAAPALRVFELFLPVGAEVPAELRAQHGSASYADAVARFDEQRGIDFWRMLGEAERLTVAHTSLTELRSTAESALKVMYQSWHGPAATASHQHFVRQIEVPAAELLSFLKGGAMVLAAAVDQVFEACRLKAVQVVELAQDATGFAPPEVAASVVRWAKGEHGTQDELLRVAEWLDGQCGSSLAGAVRQADCALTEPARSYLVDQSRRWVRDVFLTELHGDGGALGVYSRFVRICDDTAFAVDLAWQVVNDYFAGYESGFGAPSVVVSRPGAPVGGDGGTVPAAAESAQVTTPNSHLADGGGSGDPISDGPAGIAVLAEPNDPVAAGADGSGEASLATAEDHSTGAGSLTTQPGGLPVLGGQDQQRRPSQFGVIGRALENTVDGDVG